MIIPLIITKPHSFLRLRLRTCVPKAGIKDRDKWLYSTDTVGCNYLCLPLIAASGTHWHTYLRSTIFNNALCWAEMYSQSLTLKTKKKRTFLNFHLVLCLGIYYMAWCLQTQWWTNLGCVYIYRTGIWSVNTLRPRQNGRHFQTTFSNVFSWMKMYEFRLRFQWSLFPRFKLTIFLHWFW